MKNMKVSKKLTMSFILVITLTIIVGVVGVLGMMHINSGSKEMFERQSQPLADLGVAREYFQRLRVGLRDVVLASGNMSELEIIESKLSEYERGFIAYMEAYRPTMINPETIELYDEIMSSFNEYQPHMQQIMASAKVHAPPVQMNIMMSVLTGPTDFIMDALDYLAYERVSQAAYLSDVNSFWFNALLFIIITVIVVSIAIALVLTRRISAQISKPLTEIGSFANQVSTGQINMSDISENSINVCSADEIGALARILEQSYIQLNEYEQSKIILQRLASDNAALESLNRMKNEFFQNMNHDFKTPLTVVSASVLDAADMLGFDFDKDELRGSLEDAQREIMRMARMVDSLIKYSSLHDNRKDMAPLDIAPLLRQGAETYRVLLERHSNTLSLDIPASLPLIFGNTDMLLHVLSNLFSNANRYTRNGEVAISARNNSQFVSVTVTDTGMGIKKELLPNVFDRGVSDGGTGLGLSICKAAIEAHKGTITIKSEHEKGTAVTFTLPIYIESNKEDNENER